MCKLEELKVSSVCVLGCDLELVCGIVLKIGSKGCKGVGGQLCYIVFLESDFRGVISKTRMRLAFHSALYFFVETLEFIYFEQSPGESEVP